MIPYGRQTIDEDDIKAVADVLRSDWLTTGPRVAEFEKAVADFVGAKYAVAVSSGTAALHAAMYAIDIKPGDEVIVPPITFTATANCVVFQGGTPIFADVEPDTMLLDPEQIKSKITSNTKAIIAVDYAGHPCNYDSLRKITDKHNLVLVADACHALGAKYKNRPVGSLADLNIFSFHPVKHITTGEGGMVTTNDENLAERMRLFRNHGITRDPAKFIGARERSLSSVLRPLSSEPWFYEMIDLGFNYRITDMQCALGLSQLQKLPKFLKLRREIAKYYDEAFSRVPEIRPLAVDEDVLHAYHLYVVKVDFNALESDRSTLFQSLREKGIGVNVHYIPVHLHPFYKEIFHTFEGLCPVAEKAYEQIFSLPIYPGLSNKDMEHVFKVMREKISK